MDHLIAEMSGDSFEHIARLVVAKLQQKNQAERRDAINQIFDALYGPSIPKDQMLERLFGFLRDMSDNLDEATKKSLILDIQKLCMQVRTEYNNAMANNLGNCNTAASINNTRGSVVFCDKENQKKQQSLVNASRNSLGELSIGTAPNCNEESKSELFVEIKVGLLTGTIAKVDSFDCNKVCVTLPNGISKKYLRKHVKLLE